MLTGISNRIDDTLSYQQGDTIAINYTSIDKLYLVKDWSTGAGKSIDCDEYNFILQKSINRYFFDRKYANVFSQTTPAYEVFPRLTADGISYFYENNGSLYHSTEPKAPPIENNQVSTYHKEQAPIVSPKPKVIDRKAHVERNIIGFIPSKANFINGWAFGWFLPLVEYENDRDSFYINGLYTNVFPIEIIMGTFAIPYVVGSFVFSETPKFSAIDTVSLCETRKINGLSISIIENTDDFTVNGLQITIVANKMQ